MSRIRLCISAAAPLLAASLLTACQNPMAPGSRLNLGESELGWCTRGGNGSLHSLGDRNVEVDGEDPLTIVDVELENPDGVTLIGSGLLPTRSDGYTGGIGSQHGWPPPEGNWDSQKREYYSDWDDHVEAEGATIEPGETWNFVVGLRADGPTAHADGLLVTYEDEDGRRGEAKHRTEITIKPKCVSGG